MADRDLLPSRIHPLWPPHQLAALRNSDPISKVTLWDGSHVWLITRYEDVRQVLQDSRFSADVRTPGFPVLSPGRVKPKRTALSRMDDPRHGEIRRMLAGEFIPKRARALREKIRRLVSGQLDAVLASSPPVDLHAALSLPVASGLVGELLGISVAGQRLLQEYTSVIVSRTSSSAEFSAADGGLYDFCVLLVAQKQKRGTDDLLGRLVANEVSAGRLSREELCLTTKMLIVSGHETTSNMISLGALTMMLRPDWFRAMRQAPEMVGNAVEELLRYHTLMHVGLPRVATEDVVVGGTRIAAGEGVIVSVASGNRDERTFDKPNELNIRRANARHHLAFGHGVHQCLGKWVAREELRIVFPALAARIPTLRLAVPFGELSFKEDRHIYGVHELPVSW